MTLINTTPQLEQFCDQASRSEFITVDTEFIRDKTFWPQLCLVQIGTENDAVAIDTLAKGLDLAPLLGLMNDPKLLKVFHAARQDIEIFYHLNGQVPAPLFDTQVAAMVCGFGDAVSYEKLVASLTKGRIDKTMRFTDWARRPLAKKQLEYALGDVTYLRDVYLKLNDQVEKSKRGSWVDEEMAVLTSPDTYRLEPYDAWKRIKTRLRKPRHLAIFREVAAWREVEAQTRDLPRGRILRDEAITEVAVHEPKSLDDLKRLRGISREHVSGERGESLIAAVQRGLALPEEDCPESTQRQNLPPNVGPAVELLKVLLKMKCEDHNVAQKLVASTDDLEAIAIDDAADVPALTGWRQKIYGKDAIALKHGKIALTANGARLKVVRLEE